jgi:methylenetetrahydrofolate dehydrogenase (NADP+)/methenyltetrahydrofolate cyclohydrolase
MTIPREKLIDGKAFAASLREQIAAEVRDLRDLHRVQPGLAVIMVGEDPASDVYVRSKCKQTAECGMKSVERRLPEDATEKELLLLIEGLNDDPTIHGILVQLPLPRHINAERVLNTILPAKDVDGFHPVNVVRTSSASRWLNCCCRKTAR